MLAWSAGALAMIATGLLSPLRPAGAAELVFNTPDFSPFNSEVNVTFRTLHKQGVVLDFLGRDRMDAAARD